MMKYIFPHYIIIINFLDYRNIEKNTKLIFSTPKIIFQMICVKTIDLAFLFWNGFSHELNGWFGHCIKFQNLIELEASGICLI